MNKPKNQDPGFLETADSHETLELIEASESADTASTLADQLDARTQKQSGNAWFLVGGVLLVSFFGVAMVVDAVFTVMQLNALHPWIGWGAGGLLSIALLFLAFAILRELGAGAALRRTIIEAQATRAEHATGQVSRNSVRRASNHIKRLAVQSNHPCADQLQHALVAFKEHENAGHSPQTLLTVLETQALAPLDKAARDEIRSAFAKSTVATLISPFAILDAGLALHRSLVLTRKIAMLYGGVPASLASSLLIRRTFQAMLVAGTLEASDTLITNLLGGGVLAKMSTKLGEGVVSGLMVARLGLVAQKLLRPTPFMALKQPTLGDVVPDVLEGLGK